MRSALAFNDFRDGAGYDGYNGGNLTFHSRGSTARLADVRTAPIAGSFLRESRNLPSAVCSLALLTATAGRAEDAAPTKIEKEESWQVILMSGQRIGYGRSLIEPFEKDGEQLVRSVVEMHLTIKRFGQTLRIATVLHTEETPDGDLKRFTFEMRQSSGDVDPHCRHRQRRHSRTGE